MYYLIKMAYDGSKFYGFQRQKGHKSVQEEIEKALTDINKQQSVYIKGAGRTDRGVHAYMQCASFKLDVKITIQGLKRALNSRLQPYIYIREVKEVGENFHARFNVLSKKYVYKINLGSYNPIECDYVYQYPYKLDILKCRNVANLFIGVHTFHNFVAGVRDNYDCIIYKIRFIKTYKGITIHFYGKSFYRYMVRNLVGALLEVGKGKITKDHLVYMLNNKDYIKRLPTVSPNGLYLVKIKY